MNFAYRPRIAPLHHLPRVRPLPDVDEVVHALRPTVPLFCLRPDAIMAAAQRFIAGFPGKVLYAVKCNPDSALLRALWLGGVRDFDVASAAEAALVADLFPSAGLRFMHPVKPRPAIREAFHRYGIRDFAVDSGDEMDKILEEVNGDSDIGLLIRFALPKGGAVWDLSGKFGVGAAEAARLLRRARAGVRRVGLAFHVGSQCLEPVAFEAALAAAGAVIAEAGVSLDILDLGGGFPAAYDNVRPPEPEAYFAAIRRGIERLRPGAAGELWCEPGRALVAGGQSVVLQILARKGEALFVNDGIYGCLSDAGPPGFRFPMRPISGDGRGFVGHRTAFTIFGPTCDSADRLKEPSLLPADMREGDWIEIGQIGAYGTALRTAFNGLDDAMMVEVRDEPLVASPVSADQAA